MVAEEDSPEVGFLALLSATSDTGPEKPAAIWRSPEAPEADPAGFCSGFGDESPAAFEVAAAFKGVPAAFTGVVAPAVFEGIPADCLPSLALRLLTSFCKTSELKEETMF